MVPRHRLQEGSAKKKLVAVVLLAVSVLACFISFMVLLANVGELQEFIIRIPKAIDFLTCEHAPPHR